MNRAMLSTAAVLAAFTLGACGTDDDRGAAGPGRPGTETGGSGTTSVDACALFTEEELTDVLGEHQREQWSSTGESSCQWGNAEGSTVSIDIDREGSAPGGEVPSEEAMGDGEAGDGGAVYYDFGSVTFPVDERVCRLQIVVDVTDPMADRPAIDRFVGLVRDRL